MSSTRVTILVRGDFLKLSKIERQKKNSQRYSLFIEGQFAFGVAEAILIQFALHKGMTLTNHELAQIQQAEFDYSFYQKALNYLSYGLRSEKEMRDYLTRHIKQYQSEQAEEEAANESQVETESAPQSLRLNYESFKRGQLKPQIKENLVNQLIQKLKDQALLDDRIYGQAYVRTKAQVNRKGPMVIARDLRLRGLKDPVIAQALEEYPEASQLENLQILADKFIRSKQKLSLSMQKGKLFLHLIQKGYDKTLVQNFLDQYQLEADPQDQANLLAEEGLKALKKRQRKFQGYELKQRVMNDLSRKGFSYDDIQAWANQEEAWQGEETSW